MEERGGKGGDERGLRGNEKKRKKEEGEGEGRQCVRVCENVSARKETQVNLSKVKNYWMKNVNIPQSSTNKDINYCLINANTSDILFETN